MRYLKIKNDNELDPKGLFLLGASSKRNDNETIGKFGSGNKYALAYLLRNNYEITIFSGNKEIPITKTKQEFNNHEYDVIVIDGKETSITTELGVDWELWQALREVYCNSLDEGNATMEFVDTINPKKNQTHFYIKSNENIFDFVSNFDTYFSENKKVIYENEHGQILDSSSKTVNIYRKGIKAYNTNQESAYDYNFFNLDVNEERLIKSSLGLMEEFNKLISDLSDSQIIYNILKASGKNNNIENVAYNWGFKPSDEFIEAIKDLKICPLSNSGYMSDSEIKDHLIISNALFERLDDKIPNENKPMKLRKYKPGNDYVVINEASKYQNYQLDNALSFLKECDFNINYPIKIVSFKGKDILGRADIKNNIILVSNKLLDKGTNKIVETLIEEYVHLKHDVSDETRGFQDSIIEEFVSYMKKTRAYMLD